MITLDVKTALICGVLIVLIVLLIILCVVAKNLVTTIKNLNKVLEDTTVVSKIASDKAVVVDGIVGDVGDVVKDFAVAVKGNQNFMSSMSNVIKAAGSTASYFKNKDPKEQFEAAENKKWKIRK